VKIVLAGEQHGQRPLAGKEQSRGTYCSRRGQRGSHRLLQAFRWFFIILEHCKPLRVSKQKKNVI
jgi:hypothetical protein